MSTATKTRKWTSTAGPRQTKAVNKAIRDLSWMGQSFRKLTDYGASVLTSLFGKESAETCAAAVAIGERFDWTITRDNHKEVVAAFVAATAAFEIPEVDKRTTAEERAERERKRQEQDEKNAIKAEKHAQDKARIVAELRNEYPWAKQDGSSHARASANIKRELAIVFPGVKFSVRSDSFSMGDSVDISWTDGPTSREVENISYKYQEGSFDGMTDMYEYNHSADMNAISEWLGSSKYVHTSREITEEAREIVARGLCERQKIAYEGPHTRNLYGKGDYQDTVSDHAWRLLAATSFPAGAVVTGVTECIDDASYQVAFDVPDAPAPITPTIAEIQKHYHTKHNKDFWLVVLADKVERSEFDRIRAACKVSGGWYSRKWGKCPGGFAFDTEEAAQLFAKSIK